MSEEQEPKQNRPWHAWLRPEVGLLVALVAAIYCSRMTALPVAGEEGRWARGAIQMIDTGDWIVPRQQGRVFPERPPMGSWAMAIVGLMRHDVDKIAIRLPSVVAVMLMVLVIYCYTASFTSRQVAFVAGVVYATMGQVLQIGLMGESEALFTFFVGTSLLVWHMGYLRGWAPLLVWTLGYGFAGLGALVKGPQAPIYFVAVTFVLLTLQRNWRWLFSWSHASGVLTFLIVVGAWQVPYYLATDWPSVVATWTGLAADRFTLSGLVTQILKYPLETFAYPLPWSPLLLLLTSSRIRASLAESHSAFVFLITAIVVTYPTVWFASGSRVRYFMPLFPCIAILIAIIIQQCMRVDLESVAHRFWGRFVRGWAFVILGLAVVVVLTSAMQFPALHEVRQPVWFSLVFAMTSVVLAALLFTLRLRRGWQPVVGCVLALSTYLGLFFTGVMINVNINRWNDLQPQVMRIKGKIPEPHRLVSFGPVDHRFAFAYRNQIKQLDWPTDAAQVPADVEYFCFNRFKADTDESRSDGRGRTWTTTCGTLPFSWQSLGEIPCDRHFEGTPNIRVIIARRIKGRTTTTAANISESTGSSQASHVIARHAMRENKLR